MNGITLHLHQQIAALAHEKYDTIIEEGGVGSGKSLGDAVVWLDRSRWDTAQWGGLFANTWPQLQAVTGEIYKHLDAAGIERVFNCRPPKEWVEEWREKGIQTPNARDRYTNVVILRTGLHVYLATLLNQNYKQLRGWEFGWIIIEEFTAGPTQPAVEFAMERVRCGKARFARQFDAWKRQIGREDAKFEEWCRVHHRHTKYLKGNPPEDDAHWSYDMFAAMDAYAAALPGGEPSKGSDTYPNLLAGIGPVLYIPSRTKDNELNLSSGYIENQEARLDEETAAKRLGGVRTRRRSGRAYNKFTRENEHPVSYHRDRDLFICFDFNTNPTVAVFCHPLYAGEYPDQGPKAASLNLQHVGVFGEFFHVGGMDGFEMAERIISGAPSSGGHMPPNWKGLREHTGRVRVYGDATGGSKRQTFTGTNPWKIINGALGEECGDRYQITVGTINPLVQMRVRALNGRFCSSAGYRTIWIDPGCQQLIIDLETVPLAPDGSIVKPGGPRAGSKYWLRTHLSDALGYLAYATQDANRKPEDALPKIGGSPIRPPRMTI